ncbi:MAG: transglutaminase domain-containing protein, partial [Kiritimatiellae bacterium]|nr:transglutaminase domain-containing protein [Kiritimatiellia bacterium]
SMTTEDILVKALRYESITNMNKVCSATLLSADYQGLNILTWIDSEGKVLRQETPFGWTLEACDAETALVNIEGGAGGYDLLDGLAVPVQGGVDIERSLDKLEIKINGFALDPEFLVTHRQQVLKQGSNSVDMVLLKETIPTNSISLSAMPSDVQEFLESSIYIQSDDKNIMAKAKSIIGSEENSMKVALAICDWVNENMDKTPAISVPSAREILKVMSGDCNEHTYLFAALARSVGLPTKVTVGIVYNKGFFYYHAWPAVYVGRWVEMDPTFGQHAVDVTHIKLLEGELQEQMKLMGVIGRISIVVNSEK